MACNCTILDECPECRLKNVPQVQSWDNFADAITTTNDIRTKIEK